MNDDSQQINDDDAAVDVDTIMSDIAARLEASPYDTGLQPFVADFRGSTAFPVFDITPDAGRSTKPIIGPLVTTGKRMVARAAAPMVSDLGAQMSVAIADLQATIADLIEEQARLSEAIAGIERRLGTPTNNETRSVDT